MGDKEKTNRQESLSVNWLVSVLIHFPEIFALNFHVNKHKFKFSYMVNKALSEKDFFLFKEVVLSNLSTYDDLILKKPVETSVNKTDYNGLTLIEIIRKLKTISLEEVHIVNSVTKNYFEHLLISEGSENLNEFKEDLDRHEELIKHLTINYSSSKQENIFAFRQKGKVFIFDK
ncbi:hypothetical protein [Candidatus Contubernalis alkaliaceticus]|uniref:hypothetical protein n=1 Tax=Candidatus Contubernalis alkaliaceticus TaxID=338645 RepID=UPI001F4C3DCD|nr:hypothetical protein [Candidatus Contubernalis alkalaceticus]UNC91870.1 hypothetical protein HUE98_07025 [Candidatus Contubernalis alkalaceticus]